MAICHLEGPLPRLRSGRGQVGVGVPRGTGRRGIDYNDAGMLWD